MADRAEIERNIQETEDRLVVIQGQEEKGRQRLGNYRRRSKVALASAAALTLLQFYIGHSTNVKDYVLPIGIATVLNGISMSCFFISSFRSRIELRDLDVIRTKREALDLSLQAKQESLKG